MAVLFHCHFSKLFFIIKQLLLQHSISSIYFGLYVENKKFTFIPSQDAPYLALLLG